MSVLLNLPFHSPHSPAIPPQFLFTLSFTFLCSLITLPVLPLLPLNFFFPSLGMLTQFLVQAAASCLLHLSSPNIMRWFRSQVYLNNTGCNCSSTSKTWLRQWTHCFTGSCFAGFCFVLFYIVYMCLSLSSFPSSAAESVPCLSIGSFMGLLTIMHTCPAIWILASSRIEIYRCILYRMQNTAEDAFHYV